MPKSHDKNGKPNLKKAKLKSREPKNGKSLKIYTISEGIDVSRQLASKLNLSKVRKFRCNRSAINDEPRLCGNGMPMPSLAELEKIYEDSDDGDEPVANSQVEVQFKTSKEKSPPLRDEKGISTETIKTIASKMVDYLQNLSDCITIDDEYNPQPVVPQKKRKKSGMPYIVGCKERSQVQWNPKSKVGVGDTKYGVDQNVLSDIEDNPFDEPMPAVRVCKSKFNAKSEEIAERLKVAERKAELINRFLFNENKENEENIGVSNKVEHAEIHSGNSSDSNKTVFYDCSKSSQQRAFSPLPSTSSDYNTFLKNDERFHESLKCNDSILVNNESHVADDSNDTIKIDYVNKEEEIKLDTVQNNTKTDTPIDVDEYYSSINFDFDLSKCNRDEIIDVDEIIASNKVLLDKYNSMNTSDVIFIDTDHNYNLQKPTVPTQHPIDNKNPSNNKSNQRKESTIINISDVSSSVNFINLSQSVSIVAATEIDLTKTPSTNQPQPIIESTQTNLSGFSPISRWPALDLNTPSNPCKRKKKSNSKNTSTPVKDIPKNISTSSSPDNNTTVSAKHLDCPICMENVFTKQAASTLCGHIFCLACIQKAIKSSGKRCPSCRKALRGTGYHQLFL